MAKKPYSASMVMMPAKEGTCAICATLHPAELAHNYFSLFYQTRFKGVHGAEATHADSIAHLEDENAAIWKASMIKTGQQGGFEWTEPTDREPIAEPYAVSDGKTAIPLRPGIVQVEIIEEDRS